MAHEVGTPLHSIAWHVQALAEEPGVTPEMKKRVTVIDEQLTRVVRIIQDLLSSTRQRQPEPTWLPVEQVISQAAVLMEPAFHAKEIAMTVEIAGNLPLVCLPCRSRNPFMFGHSGGRSRPINTALTSNDSVPAHA